MSTNEGTVNKVQEGDAVCSLRIGQMYQGLSRYCHFLAQNPWDGDDLVQEAISKAIKRYAQTDLTPALLNKIAYHQWIDTVRKRKREIVGLDQDIIDCETDARVERMMDTVKTLMECLTAKQAVIFTLKEGFRFQIKEMADLLNISEVAVKSTLYRARQTLAREIHSVKPVSEENEQSLLYELLYHSLQADDPQVLIDRMKEIPSLVAVPVLTKPKTTQPPLNVYCMAA